MYIQILLSVLLLAENISKVCRYPGIHGRQYLTSRFFLFPNEITSAFGPFSPIALFFPSFVIVKLLEGWPRRGLHLDPADLCITGISNSQRSETKSCICLPDNTGDSSVHDPVKIR